VNREIFNETIFVEAVKSRKSDGTVKSFPAPSGTRRANPTEWGILTCTPQWSRQSGTDGALQFFIPRRKAGAHQFFTLREAELFTKPSFFIVYYY